MGGRLFSLDSQPIFGIRPSPDPCPGAASNLVGETDSCREEAEQLTVRVVSEAGGARWDPRQGPGSLGRRGGQITTLQKGHDII